MKYLVSAAIILLAIFLMVLSGHKDEVRHESQGNQNKMDHSEPSMIQPLEDFTATTAPDDVPESVHYHIIIDQERSHAQRNDAATAAVDAREPWVPDLLVSMYADQEQTWRWRNYCLQHLTNWAIDAHDLEVFETVVEGISNDDPRIAETAVFSIGRGISGGLLESIDFRDQLMDIANGSRDDRVRVSAIRALASVGDESAQSLWTQLATGHDNPLPIRVASIQMLGLHGDEQSAELLSQLARHDHPLIRQQAQQALQRLSPAPSVE